MSREVSRSFGFNWDAALTDTDAAGGLHIATKGFVVKFSDPRYQKFPPSWRGTHYCHLIAPDYFRQLLEGEGVTGVVIGRKPLRGLVPEDVVEP